MTPAQLHDRQLRGRLLRFLLRERHASAADLRERWAMPLPARVEAGDAIDGIAFEHREGDARFVLRAPRNESRFRIGDRLRLGAGGDPAACPEVILASYDPVDGTLVVEAPRFSGQNDRALITKVCESRRSLVLDRADVDLLDLLRRAVDRVFAGERELEEQARDLLARRLVAELDEDEAATARTSIERLAEHGVHLDDAQARAFVKSWAARPVHLVHGPPGSGKTWLLARLVAALVWRGERVLVTAQTHLAVDNVLRALSKVAEDFGATLPLVRVSPKRPPAFYERLGIAVARGARRVEFPARGGLVVGATIYSSLAFADSTPFHRVVFDEAAQIPLPDAMCALLSAPRWLLYGDDAQRGPVIVGDHDQEDDAAVSLFAYLRQAHEPSLLERSYRLNDALCAFPSACFYDERLQPAEGVGERRFAAGGDEGRFREILDEPAGPVLVTLDHEGYRTACPPERQAAADLVEELLVRRGVSPRDVAVISPFRQQNQEIIRELRRRLGPEGELPLIDTVERIQGQEREVVIVSLTCSDPDALRHDTSFFFSPNRLNVSLTRARTRLVVLASPALLQTMPRDHAGLVRLEIFHRMFADFPRIRWPVDYV